MESPYYDLYHSFDIYDYNFTDMFNLDHEIFNLSISHVLGNMSRDEPERTLSFIGLTNISRILTLLFCTCAVTANILALIGISKIGHPLDSHYILVSSIITADLMIGIGPVLILIAFEFSDNVVDYPFIHYMVLHFNTGMFYCLIFNITTMAVNHYVAIAKTHLYNSLFSRKRIICVVVGIWVVSFLLASLTVLVGCAKMYSNNQDEQSFRQTITETDPYGIFPIFPVVFLALLTLCFTYINIHCHVRNITTESERNPQGSLRIKYAAMTTIWIIVSFVVTWIPMLIVWLFIILLFEGNPMKWTDRQYDIIFWIDSFFTLLPALNAVCDQIIYSVRLKKIRDGIRSRCACCPCKNHRQLDQYEIQTVVTGN